MRSKNDMLARCFRDLRIAGMLLTRLPFPPVRLEDGEESARAGWAFPLAGGALALIAGLVACCTAFFGLPASATAALALASLVMTSGAMHEDGLADCADGFWGGWERTRRLEIMHDSRIGAYGVIALILGFALRWSAYTGLFAAGSIFAPLLVAALLSRGGMVFIMDSLPNARDDGLSKSTGRPGRTNTWIAGGIGAVSAVVFFGLSGFWAILAALIAALACGRIAKAKIGGQTGDVLGATQQITEIAVLLALLAII